MSRNLAWAEPERAAASEDTVATVERRSPPRRYAVESAIIEYEVTGSVEGRETLYFDRWGMREVTVSRTRLSGLQGSPPEHRLLLFDGQWAYTLDLDRGAGTRTKSPLAGDLGGTGAVRSAEYVLRQLGGKVIAREEVAGLACEVWEVPALNAKLWLRDSLTLKVAPASGSGVTKTALAVEEGVRIPDEKFELPEGIELEG
jgi:hypothetical protein